MATGLANKFRTSSKSCGETSEAIRQASLNHQFGVLAIMDLRAKMQEKGISFDKDCIVLDVCNPTQASIVLKHDMTVSLAMPCRIAVYSENGTTVVGYTTPSTILSQYVGKMLTPELEKVGNEVDQAMAGIVDEALQNLQG